jgi:hypothetical protein
MAGSGGSGAPVAATTAATTTAPLDPLLSNPMFYDPQFVTAATSSGTPTLTQAATAATAAAPAATQVGTSGATTAATQVGQTIPTVVDASGNALSQAATNTLWADFVNVVSQTGNTELTFMDYINALGKGLQVVSSAVGVYNAFKGPGSQTVSSTTTTSNLPSYMQQGAQQLWDDYINDFYGLGGGKSVKTMFGEDTNYVAGLDKNLAALAGRQVSDMDVGRGMFTPTNVSFGGNKAFSFVPRSNRDLAKQQLTTGGIQNELLKPHTPNEAPMAYNTFLGNLALTLNKGAGSSATTTGTVPGTSTATNINTGLGAVHNLFNALNNYNKTESTTTPVKDASSGTTMEMVGNKLIIKDKSGNVIGTFGGQ